MDLLLGIDMGTGSTKGVLVDTAGVVLASAAISHSMNLPRPGWAEVDAEATWWREVCEISSRLMREMPLGRPWPPCASAELVRAWCSATTT